LPRSPIPVDQFFGRWLRPLASGESPRVEGRFPSDARLVEPGRAATVWLASLFNRQFLRSFQYLAKLRLRKYTRRYIPVGMRVTKASLALADRFKTRNRQRDCHRETGIGQVRLGRFASGEAQPRAWEAVLIEKSDGVPVSWWAAEPEEDSVANQGSAAE
jgi:hypothetical protein